MRRIAIGSVLVLGLLGCTKKKKEEPSTDEIWAARPGHCFVKTVTSVSGAVTAGFTFDNQFRDLHPEGSMRLEVAQRGPEVDSKVTAPAGCTLTAPITAGSYVGNVATIQGRFTPPCPPASPNMVTEVRGYFAMKDTDYGLGCTYFDAVPSELGGAGLDTDRQASALARAAALKSAPKPIAALDAYRASLVKVRNTVHTAPTTPPPSTCAGASGVVPVFPMASLYEAVASVAPPLQSPEPYAGKPVETELVGELTRSDAASAGALIALGQKVPTLGNYVAVRRMVSMRPPTTALDQHATEGTFDPGLWVGVLYVVDRTTGRVACAKSFQTTGTHRTAEGTDRSAIEAQLSAGFFSEPPRVALEVLKSIAPGLTPN